MPGSHREHDRLGGQGDQLQPGWSTAGKRDKREVQPAVDDLAGHFGGAAGVSDRDLDPGVAGAERGQQPGEVDRAHPLGLHRAEHDLAAQPSLRFVDGVAGGLRCGQRRARLGQQRSARVGQLDVMGRTVEQACPELVLELADARGHRRLDDVEPVGRAREAALFGHGDERGELPQLHTGDVIARCDNHKQLFALITIASAAILKP